MKLQDQVCTLEQAKRLKEFGVRQDASHAAWLRNECHKETDFWCWPVEAQGISNRGYSSPAKGCLEGFSAFTVAELGMMLPPSDISRGEFTNFSKGVNGLSWSVDCSLWDAPGFPKDGEPGLIHHYTEAECRAELLIILLENKLITPEEVNARLCG